MKISVSTLLKKGVVIMTNSIRPLLIPLLSLICIAGCGKSPESSKPPELSPEEKKSTDVLLKEAEKLLQTVLVERGALIKALKKTGEARKKALRQEKTATKKWGDYITKADVKMRIVETRIFKMSSQQKSPKLKRATEDKLHKVQLIQSSVISGWETLARARGKSADN